MQSEKKVKGQPRRFSVARLIGMCFLIGGAVAVLVFFLSYALGLHTVWIVIAVIASITFLGLGLLSLISYFLPPLPAEDDKGQKHL